MHAICLEKVVECCSDEGGLARTHGDFIMARIVAIPQIVELAVEQFADLFSCEPQRKHLAEYLTGLMVARRKTVNGISSEFLDATDQSCLNRFLTEVDWNVEQLNERRLELLQREPSTRYHEQGVIAIDNVLTDHDGQFIKDVGWFWDHAEERHKIAHDDLFANYVCGSGKHYPLDFRRFKKREQCESTGETFTDHGVLFRDLIDWVCQREIPGTFAFDSYFSSAESLNYIHGKRDGRGQARAYVGALKFNRKVCFKGREWKAEELAASIRRESRKELRRGDRRQWYFTCTVRLPNVNHPVRILILWKNRRDTSPAKILITNRIGWEVTRIVRGYGDRWTGTETYHRDGKQELGMGDCQLRSGQGQTRHMYLVMLAYSLLMIELRQSRAKTWACEWLKTIGQACRAIDAETLRTTIEWAIAQVTENSRNAQSPTNP
jgi:hypothetical protein